MSWYRSRHAGPSVTPALPTQQKTITATTSQQVVTPDSGYVLDEVTVNPQKHTASFTPTANLVGASGNANDMGVNHNKRYINTSGMITPSGTKSITSNGTHDVSNYANASVSVDTSGTSITPSNSSPVRIYSGSTYTPTSSGYAISSYSSVTPSNSSPASLSSSSIYKTSGSGYAISSYSSISPSNSSPASMSSGSFYKPSSSGYAISSYSSVTPSSSGASFSSGMVKMSSSGYAYSSRPSTTHTGELDALNKNNYTLYEDVIRGKTYRQIDLGASHTIRYVNVYEWE